MKSKIKDEHSVSNPFETSTHKTEWTCAAKVEAWINAIVEEKNLPLGKAEVETKKRESGKRGDIVLFETPRSQHILCVIEAKRPYYDVFAEELKDDARKKANQRKAKYFATTNFKKLIWWKTKEANDTEIPEEQQISDKFFLSEIENLDDIEQTRYSEPIKRGLEDFLFKLCAVHFNKEPEPKQPIDEFLVLRLQEKIRVLSRYYRLIIDDACHKNTSFAKALKNWFLDQGWSFSWQPQDFDKAARQTAYLLVNKILFYNLLQAKRPHDLDPLDIPDGLTKGAVLQDTLQSYFNQVLKIDYETIYSTDFIDAIAFPDVKEVVREIKELVKIFKRYDFSKLGYDVIGRIFERLIPWDERHNLGQYFTNADVVDLILRFCINHEDDKVLDPSCGAGTFLVRAYQHKKLMNQKLTHEKILDSLWGSDISKFPAHLATINLAIKNLSVDKNYPNILHKDFFSLLAADEGLAPKQLRKARTKTLGEKEREVFHPRYVDAVVGNPPYTRQEEIGEISPEHAKYKEDLIRKALYYHNAKMADIGKRAGIYAYFFVHGTKFLTEGGTFGFIVSNSWLDVDYGKALQEFFLNNYKIVAVIESKVERWFEDADINTCIIILKKCNDKEKRDENIVRFVYLKKPLRHFIPPAQDMWEKQVERKDAIDSFKKTVLSHSALYENEAFRIYTKLQKELWEEGFDAEEQKYTGAKWGKYLRAPEIFFKMLSKAKDKLVPLKEVADVRFGIKTGANEFFYLTEEEITKRKIEKEFWMHKDQKGNWTPNYVIKSPQECNSIVVRPGDLKYRVLMIHKDKKDLKGTNVLKYIHSGERKGFHKRSTCASRGERWYDLGKRTSAPFLHPMVHNDRQVIVVNLHSVYADHNLFEIQPKRKEWLLPLATYFASSPAIIVKELGGRVNLGEGALKTEGVDIEGLLSVRPKEIGNDIIKQLQTWVKKYPHFEFESVFKELGASSVEDVRLDKVKSDRRELDKIIMGDILGLTEDEQLEVYKAVIDLVKSRIEKAKSVDKKTRTKDGIDIEALKNSVLEGLKKET